MSLSSEEEDQFLTGGPQPSDEEDANDLSSSDLSDDEPFKTPSHPAHPPPTHAQMLSFGPPYYGRPPTPLPPSPSLTSLLRPSRPTTPDPSDDEANYGHGQHGGGAAGGGGAGGLHGNGGGGSADQHHSSSHLVPRASPKVPTYEYYGFVLYLFSSCCFLIYLLWSYLPSPFLHALGIHYYPDRWWSLATPAFIVVLLVYIYVALALYNTEYLTLPLQSLETIVDDAGKIAVVDGRGRIVVSEERRRNLERERERRGKSDGRHHQRKQSANGHGLFGREREVDWRECWNEGTDAVMDVPLAGVCEILYGSARVEDQDELAD